VFIAGVFNVVPLINKAFLLLKYKNVKKTHEPTLFKRKNHFM